MKKKYLYTIVLLIMLTLFAGTNNQDKDDVEKLKSQIEKLNDKFIKANVDEDLESYLSIYTDDAIVMPPFSPMLEGQEALIEAWYKKQREGVKALSGKATILEIWTSEDRVYERGSFAIHFSKKGLSQTYNVYGSYFSIWEKQEDGSLKMKYDISNLDHGF